MFYALEAKDLRRLRNLVIAYEGGQLTKPSIDSRPYRKAQDTYLAYVPTAVAANEAGTAYLAGLSNGDPPTPSYNSGVVLDVYNPTGGTLPVGYCVLCREPSAGYYLPAFVAASTGTANCAQVVTAASCSDDTFSSTVSSLCGNVEINGVSYPVNFTVS